MRTIKKPFRIGLEASQTVHLVIFSNYFRRGLVFQAKKMYIKTGAELK